MKSERYTYGYDAWGRPLTVTHRLENLSPVVLHSYAYDAVGRLESDSRSGDADLNTSYMYNVRSWLTDIKVGGNAQQGTLGETFTEKLYYQNLRPVNPQQGVQWSGNVSAMDWMAGSDGVSRRYDFAYDGLSRLTGAGYADDGAGQNDYSRGYGYDRNGNVTLLATATDTTQITYLGNHLTSGNNFTYDANGNLTKDLIRSISSISYNILNLPQQVEQQVSLRGGIVPFDQEPTFYLYTASGVKLQSMTGLAAVLPGHPDTRDRTDYVGNLIYDRTSLKRVLFDGGYVEVSGNTKNYRFFVKDHLGNNRLVTDASGSILQTNHYDPYGESLPDGAAVDSGNPYKWSGKEYDAKALAYDFGARHYTSSIPRWTTMDPLAEKYYSISPYVYCRDNPINHYDYNGMIDWDLVLKGAAVAISGAISAGVIIMSCGIATPFVTVLFVSNTSSIGLGSAMMITGALSDPSETTEDIKNNMPTSAFNAIGKSADIIMGNQGKELETATGMMELIGNASLPTKGVWSTASAWSDIITMGLMVESKLESSQIETSPSSDETKEKESYSKEDTFNNEKQRANDENRAKNHWIDGLSFTGWRVD